MSVAGIYTESRRMTNGLATLRKTDKYPFTTIRSQTADVDCGIAPNIGERSPKQNKNHKIKLLQQKKLHNRSMHIYR